MVYNDESKPVPPFPFQSNGEKPKTMNQSSLGSNGLRERISKVEKRQSPCKESKNGKKEPVTRNFVPLGAGKAARHTKRLDHLALMQSRAELALGQRHRRR